MYVCCTQPLLSARCAQSSVDGHGDFGYCYAFVEINGRASSTNTLHGVPGNYTVFRGSRLHTHDETVARLVAPEDFHWYAQRARAGELFVHRNDDCAKQGVFVNVGLSGQALRASRANQECAEAGIDQFVVTTYTHDVLQVSARLFETLLHSALEQEYGCKRLPRHPRCIDHQVAGMVREQFFLSLKVYFTELYMKTRTSDLLGLARRASAPAGVGQLAVVPAAGNP